MAVWHKRGCVGARVGLEGGTRAAVGCTSVAWRGHECIVASAAVSARSRCGIRRARRPHGGCAARGGSPHLQQLAPQQVAIVGEAMDRQPRTVRHGTHDRRALRRQPLARTRRVARHVAPIGGVIPADARTNGDDAPAAGEACGVVGVELRQRGDG
eukprot:4857053-Prymnesium_polylepis.1